VRLEDAIESLANLIVASQRIVVFTGAGVSTESGIADFRGPDGLWTKVDPEDFTYQRFVGDPETRTRIWHMHETTGFRFDDVEPNVAHHSIAKLGKLDCIITQNVDGLHQKAGNTEERVLELHGNMQWVKCIRCGVRHPFSEVRSWIESGVEVPECATCGGILKPDAVFFGEAMPQRVTAEAQRRSLACDLCIVIGSTLGVYPAALMPEYAHSSGAKLVIINEGRTELDHLAHIRIEARAIRIEARAGKAMSQTITLVKEKLGVGD
jgi:NAD-dependent deacetylase